MEITIQTQIPIHEWTFGGTTATLRIEANGTFFTSGDVQVLHGTYKSVTCTISGTTLTVPSFTIDSTTDGVPNNQTYDFVIYDHTGAKQWVLGSQWRVPHDLGASISWATLATFNRGTTNTFYNETYTKAEIDSLITNYQPIIDASLANIGKTRLDKDPDSASDPAAVGINSSRVPQVTLDLDHANDLGAAVTSIGATVTDLIIGVDTTITTAVSVPSTLRLIFKENAKIIDGGGGSITINSQIEAPPVQIFSGFATTEVIIESGQAVYPEWWGAVGYKTTVHGSMAVDSTLAFQSAVDSRVFTGSTQNGIKIILQALSYKAGNINFEGMINVIGNTATTGNGTGTLISVPAGQDGFYQIADSSVAQVSYFRDIAIISADNRKGLAANPTPKTGSHTCGIYSRVKIKVENVRIEGFAYSGCMIEDISDTANNQNLSQFLNLYSAYNGNNYLQVDTTATSNVITSTNAAFDSVRSIGQLVRIPGATHNTITTATTPALTISDIQINVTGTSFVAGAIVTFTAEHGLINDNVRYIQFATTPGISGIDTGAGTYYQAHVIDESRIGITQAGVTGTYTSGGSATLDTICTTTDNHELGRYTSAATFTIADATTMTDLNGTWTLSEMTKNTFTVKSAGVPQFFANTYDASSGHVIQDLVAEISVVDSPTQVQLSKEFTAFDGVPVAKNADVSISDDVLRILGHGLDLGGGRSAVNSQICLAEHIQADYNEGSGINSRAQFGQTIVNVHTAGNRDYSVSLGDASIASSMHTNFFGYYSETSNETSMRLYNSAGWFFGNEINVPSGDSDFNGSVNNEWYCRQRMLLGHLPQTASNSARLNVLGINLNAPIRQYHTDLGIAADFQGNNPTNNARAVNVFQNGRSTVSGDKVMAIWSEIASQYSQSDSIAVYGKATGTGTNHSFYADSGDWGLYVNTGNISSGGYQDMRGMSAPAVSNSDEGRFYYDSTADKVKVSLNAGAYNNILSAADWAEPGAIGGTTPAAATFTTLTANTSLVINGGTALTTTNRTGTGNLVLENTPTLVTPEIGAATGTSLAATGAITSSGTAGVGYATGAGSTVTQITSRTTGVTINAICGAITLVSAAGSTSWQTFTVTNSTVAATDTIRVCQKSGTDLNMIHVTAVGAGSFDISFATTGGTTTETPVFNFTVIKGVDS